jgi:hypothetical protein
MNQSQVSKVMQKIGEYLESGDSQPYVTSMDKRINSIPNTRAEEIIVDNYMEITTLIATVCNAAKSVQVHSPLYYETITDIVTSAFLFGYAIGLEDDGIPEAFKEA